MPDVENQIHVFSYCCTANYRGSYNNLTGSYYFYTQRFKKILAFWIAVMLLIHLSTEAYEANAGYSTDTISQINAKAESFLESCITQQILITLVIIRNPLFRAVNMILKPKQVASTPQLWSRKKRFPDNNNNKTI